MSVTITISDKLFKRLEELAGDYEPSPEDFDIYMDVQVETLMMRFTWA